MPQRSLCVMKLRRMKCRLETQWLLFFPQTEGGSKNYRMFKVHVMHGRCSFSNLFNPQTVFALRIGSHLLSASDHPHL